MKRIIQLAVLAALIYVVVQQAPQLVENVSDLGSGLSRRGSSVGLGACVVAAEGASETFGRELRQFSDPPIDLEAWDLFIEGLKEQIYHAEAECSCPRTSCERATEALGELNRLIADFDNSLRGSGVPLNPARQQETIDRLLKRAREFDRQGN